MADKSTKKEKKRLSRREYLAAVESKGLRTARHISTAVFLVIWAALIIGIVVLGCWFIPYCDESFDLYEASQLHYMVDATVEKLNSAETDELMELLVSDEPECTQFDDAAALKRKQYDILAQMELSATEVRGSSGTNHTYVLYGNDTPVGEFEIAAVSEESRLMLLTITQWEYAGGKAYTSYTELSRSYTVPEGFTVTVNGITLGEEYLTGERQAIAAFEYVEEYADMPGMVTYSVEGLREIPQAQILDNLGNPVEFDLQAEEVVLPEAWTAQEISTELETMVIDYAKLWSNYTLNDASLTGVKTILIPDSSLLEYVLASDHDRRYVDSHTLKGYSDITVSEYTVYADNCFSCRVTMDRTVILKRNSQEVHDTVDIIIYFVYLDTGADGPCWYIADTMTAGN